MSQRNRVHKLKSAARDESGNVAIIFGLAILPLLAAAGAAVDYSRMSSVRAATQLATDGAALAGIRHLRGTNAELTARVTEYAKANLPERFKEMPLTIEALENRTALRVTAEYTVPTVFMHLFGNDVMKGSVLSEARSSSDNAEVAVALDLTGSMRQHVPALRQATRELINILQPDATGNVVQMALVPYVAAVNVSGHPNHMNWMDVRAEARFHGQNFEINRGIQDRRCDPPPAPEPVARAPVETPAEPAPTPRIAPATGSGTRPAAAAEPAPARANPPPAPVSRPPLPRRSPDLGFLDHDGVRVAENSRVQDSAAAVAEAASIGFNWILDQLAPTQAQAQPHSSVVGTWPYGEMSEDTPMDCDRVVPAPINHFHLFNGMGVRWKGCVEARPSTLDVTDERPTAGRPDTFFVPYLWPDESDNPNHEIRNNYLSDTSTIPSWIKNRDQAALRQAWFWKYAPGSNPIIDENSFLMRGPNAACPDPIVPLTTNRSRLLSTADNLRPYAASGTNIAEGLAWTWRLISPRFVDEAAPFDERNKKYVILMTDGFNDVVAQEVNWNRSDYGSIGYASRRRLGTNNRDQITERLDQRVATICQSIKNDDIQIFTVLFDPMGYTSSSQVEALLADCATSRSRHVFKASSAEDLIGAFRAIGSEINSVRLSR